MTLYLVEHIPDEFDNVEAVPVRKPSDLESLARHSLSTSHGARWITTFTPDLHDDRHFSLWESQDADDIRAVMERFGFLDDGTVKVFAVRQWGPEDVIGSDNHSDVNW